MATAVKEKPAQAAKHDAYIETQLTQARRRIRLVDLSAALLGFVAGTIVFTLVMVLLDSKFILSAATRQVALLSYAAVAGAYLLYFVARPLTRQVNPYYAARLLEDTLPEGKNRVINWIDLHDQQLPGAIRGAIGQKAAKDLSKTDPERAISNRRALVAGGVAGVLAAVLLVVLFFQDRPFGSLRRAFTPFGTQTGSLARTEITRLRPEQDDATVTIGKSVTISAEIEYYIHDLRRSDVACVLYRATQDEPFRKRLLHPDELAHAYARKKEWSALFRADEVGDGFFYKIAAGDAETPEYRIRVRSAPLISDFVATYSFRPYTGKADRSQTMRALREIRGTTVNIEAKTNRDLKDGRIEFDGLDGRREQIYAQPGREPRTLRFRLKLDRPGKYRIHFTSTEGEHYIDPVPHDVVVLPDLGPRVRITEPAKDLTLPADAQLEIKGDANDDYGVAAVALHATLNGAPLAPRPYLADKLGKPGYGTPRELDYRDIFDLATLKTEKGEAVQPEAGQEIEYWLVAADACDAPTPNVSLSEPRYKIKIAPPRNDPKAREKERQDQQDKQKEHEAKQDEKLKQEQKKREEDRQREEKQERAEQQKREQDRKDNKDGDKKDEPKQNAGGENKTEQQKREEDTQRKAEEIKDKLDKREKEQAGKQQGDKQEEKKPGEGRGQEEKPGDSKDKEDKKGEDKPGKGKPEDGKGGQGGEKKDAGDDKGKAGEGRSEGKGDDRKDKGEGKGGARPDDKGEKGQDKPGEGKGGKEKPRPGEGKKADPSENGGTEGERKPGDPKPGDKVREGEARPGDPKGKDAGGKSEAKPGRQEDKNAEGREGAKTKPGDPSKEQPGECKNPQAGGKPGAAKGKSGKPAGEKGEGQGGEPKGGGSNAPETAKPGDAKQLADTLKNGTPAEKEEAERGLKRIAGNANDPQAREEAENALKNAGKAPGPKDKQGTEDGMGKAGQPQGKEGDQEGPGKGKGKTGTQKGQKGNQGNQADGGVGRGSDTGERTQNEPSSEDDGTLPSKSGPKGKHRPSMMQLDDFRKKITPDMLKDLKMSKEDYQRFLRDYEEMAKRPRPRDDDREELHQPGGAGKMLPSMGGKTIRPGQGKIDDLRNEGRPKPPPGYRDSYAEFLQLLRQGGK